MTEKLVHNGHFTLVKIGTMTGKSKKRINVQPGRSEPLNVRDCRANAWPRAADMMRLGNLYLEEDDSFTIFLRTLEAEEAAFDDSY
jgi:hypothetical protein